MRIYESKDPELVATVGIPDEWLASDYDTYIAAQWEAEKAGYKSTNIARLAGVLALAIAGRVTLEVPGIDMSTPVPDLGNLNAKAMGFVIRAVAISLEQTQLVPFSLRAPSGISTPESNGE